MEFYGTLDDRRKSVITTDKMALAHGAVDSVVAKMTFSLVHLVTVAAMPAAAATADFCLCLTLILLLLQVLFGLDQVLHQIPAQCQYASYEL